MAGVQEQPFVSASQTERELLSVQVRVAREASAEGLPLPAYATPGSAGIDLYAALVQSEPVMMAPGARALIPTGVRLHIPPGYEGQVRARSGLALNHGIGLLNAPGTIDSDYRGELRILLINLGDESFTISRGDRIAQVVIAPVARVELKVVPTEELDKTPRGEGGFGSTGSGI
jgi:dUTP pyrophosphatase